MTYIYNDGGRKLSGFKGEAKDCACRAISIALGIPYADVYNELAKANKLSGGKRSARNGMPTIISTNFLMERGWRWTSAPQFDGRKAKAKDLPKGIFIARQAKHLVAVIDGVPHDTWDSSNKMIYGYWRKI